MDRATTTAARTRDDSWGNVDSMKRTPGRRGTLGDELAAGENAGSRKDERGGVWPRD